MSNFSITTIHHNLHSGVSKSVLKSIIGSLNATAIAYARGHLRYNALENVASRITDRVPTIDDRNDADAAIADAAQRAAAGEDMGFATQMQSGELAERMMNLRGYFAGLLEDMKASPNDTALTIAETVKFQMDRPGDVNDTLIEALALAVDLDADVLKAAKLKMLNDDASDLKANAGKIVTYLEAFGDGEFFSDADAEACFDALPAHCQYKLMAAAIRAYDKQSQSAMMRLLRGSLDAATDIKFIKAVRSDAVVWLTTFSRAKRLALDEYMERGGQLPAFDDRVVITEDTQPRAPRENKFVSRNNESSAAAAARLKEDNDAAEAEQQALKAAAQSKAKGGMQRAPKPAKA